jgi:hypothetical protein
MGRSQLGRYFCQAQSEDDPSALNFGGSGFAMMHFPDVSNHWHSA